MPLFHLALPDRLVPFDRHEEAVLSALLWSRMLGHPVPLLVGNVEQLRFAEYATHMAVPVRP